MMNRPGINRPGVNRPGMNRPDTVFLIVTCLILVVQDTIILILLHLNYPVVFGLQ